MNSRRRASVAVLAAFALASGWLGWRALPGRAERTPAVSALHAGEEVAVDAERVAEKSEVSLPSASQDPIREPMHSLAGIVVHADRPADLVRQPGMLDVRISGPADRAEEGTTRDVPVVDGAWRIDRLAADARVHVLGVTVAGAPARLVGEVMFQPSRSPVTLTIEVAGSITLDVRDSVDRARLDEVTVARREFDLRPGALAAGASDWLLAPRLEAPGAPGDRIVAAGRPAPVTVSRPLDQERLVVRADDYMWALAPTARQDSEFVEVLLDPAGELILDGSRLSHDVRARVDLRPVGEPGTTGLASGPEVAWEGVVRPASVDVRVPLRTGRYSVMWGPDAAEGDEIEYRAQTVVDVAHRSDCVVNLVPHEVREKVEWTAFLWSDTSALEEPTITLVGLRDVDAVGVTGVPAGAVVDRIRMHRKSHPVHGSGWSFGPRAIEPGRYLVAFSPVGVAQVVEIGAGANELAVRIDGLRRRKIELIDRRARAPVRVRMGTLGIAPPGEDGLAAAGLQRISVGGNVSVLEVQLPPGMMHYTLMTESGAFLTGRSAILPDVDAYELELDVPHLLEIDVTYDGHSVAVSRRWVDELVVRGEDGMPVPVVSRHLLQRGKSSSSASSRSRVKNSFSFDGGQAPPPRTTIVLGIVADGPVSVDPRHVPGLGATTSREVALSSTGKTRLELAIGG